MKNISIVAGLGFAAAIFTSFSLSASEPTAAEVITYKKMLADVPVLELPARAAELVKQAKDAERDSVTLYVTAAITELKPAVVPAVVGTIARTEPKAAATASAAAAKFQPTLAASIAKSASTAAPRHVSNIVYAVCRVAPASYKSVAVAASQAVPSARPKILAGLSTAIPTLTPYINQATAQNTTDQTAGAIVTAAAELAGPRFMAASVSAGSPSFIETIAAAGPIVKPPFHDLTGTPTEVTQSSTQQVPANGRNYAAP